MFKIDLVSLNGKTESLIVKSVIIPTSDGQRTVLDKHMDISIEIVPGVAKFRLEKEVLSYFVSTGFFHFSKGSSMMLVDAFESSDEIDFKRAQRAYEEASNVLHVSENSFEIKKAEQALKRALGRLRLE